MPRIAEFKEIDGKVWVCADIENMENGSAWWSPKEQAENARGGYNLCRYDFAYASLWQRLAWALRGYLPLMANER